MRQSLRITLLLMATLWSTLLAACGGVLVEAPSDAAQPSPSGSPSVVAAAPSATTAPSATSAPTTTFVPTAMATPSVSAAPTATATVATATTEPTVSSTPTATTTVAASPDGAATASPSAAVRPDLRGQIAFVRDGSIYVYQPQTGAVNLLVEDGRDPQFSRDGTQIVFVRDDGLYLAAADGTNERQIASQTSIQSPRWTDDGSKVAFERVVDPTVFGRGEIWTIELPNGEPVRVAAGADPAWAPDGKRLTYVSEAEGAIRRNQLRLTNWQGQRDWGVIRTIPANTPSIGIPGNQLPPSDLEHLLFAPVWDAEGKVIYVPALVLMQVETDFVILERADATNGGSIFLTELPFGVLDAVSSPDRRAVLFTTGSARGDIQLFARPIAADASDGAYSWAQTREVAMNEAPAWSPTSDAVAYIRCSLDDPNRCDLALLKPGLEQPEVLVPNLFAGAAADRGASLSIAWGQ